MSIMASLYRTPYGPRLNGYLRQQRNFFAVKKHPLVGQHGEHVLGIATKYNMVTPDTLERENRTDAHNGVLAQLALYHPLTDPRFLPRNLAPDNDWNHQEHAAFCAYRALDGRPDATLADYQKGPLGQRIRGLPPLAFLIRMADLVSIAQPEVIAQMPVKPTSLFVHIDDATAYNTIVAQKVLDLYAPFAEVLGFGGLCRALKDMAVTYLYPERRKDVQHQMAEFASAKEASDTVLATVIAGLHAAYPVHFQHILRSEKSRGSSVIKLETKPDKYQTIEDFSDLAAALILTETPDQIYDLVHKLTQSGGVIERAMLSHAPGCRFSVQVEDYVSIPKAGSLDGYRSYHIDVRIDRANGQRTHTNFEIILRTRAMHEACERGGAAHFLYKGDRKDPEAQRRIVRLYDDLLLALVTGSVVVPDAQNRLAMSLLGHEQTVVVTVKFILPKGGLDVRTVQLPAGASVFDALVATGADVQRGVQANDRSLTDSIVPNETIHAHPGGRKLGRPALANLMEHARTVAARNAIAGLWSASKR